MNKLQDSIGKWGDETFGHSGNPIGSSQGIYHHMDKEFSELAEAIDEAIVQSANEKKPFGKCDKDHIAEECADIFILMCSLAHVNGFSIREAVGCKMAINRSREWGKPDKDGVIEHIPTADVKEIT